MQADRRQATTGGKDARISDIGTGIPRRRNVHQVAGQTVPGSRVVCAGHDPIVPVYAVELLTGTAGVVPGRPAGTRSHPGPPETPSLEETCD